MSSQSSGSEANHSESWRPMPDTISGRKAPARTPRRAGKIEQKPPAVSPARKDPHRIWQKAGYW